MFFCILLLCQVSLAQQTAHVEGALLLGEKRNIRGGAGCVSGYNSERRCWEGRQQLVQSVRESDLLNGMCSLVVATRMQDPFLLEAINTFVVDTQLWQGCRGQLLQSQCPESKLLLPEQSLSAGFPAYSCPDQVAHGERHHRKLP